MIRFSSWYGRLLLCGSVLAWAPSARAAGPDDDKAAAAAESLFQEGRKLMEAKRYAEACPKFAASQKMSPAIGTLLNLADCYEKNNQIASAWGRFQEAMALAKQLNRGPREQTARERAEKLEPRLIKLTILSRASGVEVKLDGAPIDPSVLGTAIPVDAGKHVLEASAKGKKPFSKEIEVSEKAKTPTVEIPPLEDEPKVVGPAEPEKKDTVTEPPPEDKKVGSTQRTVGLVVGAAGIVGLGVGGFFALRARSKWDDADPHCDANDFCDETGFGLAEQAHNAGNVATVASIAGGVFLVGGLILFFTAPKPQKAGLASVRVGFGPGSLLLGGQFQ
jgi:hypothetical protein